MIEANPSSASTAAVTQHILSILPGENRTALCSSVLPALLDSIASIATSLRASHHVVLAGGTNAFGDDQLNVDVTAEHIVRAALAGCPSVATASSEEDPVERATTTPVAPVVPAITAAPAINEPAQEVYTVAFDPLDGSSIIAPNWTVGTIVGIWDGATALRKRPADGQIAAVLGIYGPRTSALVALRIPGAAATPQCCLELGLAETGCWEVVRPAVRLAPLSSVTTRYFAPANARAAAEDERYRDLILRYITDKYALRYSGGLVPDVMHMLVKGHGIYLSPVTAASTAKLRRLYELCPIALILECAGGTAVDAADFRAVLDVPVESTDERVGLVCGTAEEVAKAVSQLSQTAA
ncbi:sedoheptulose-1,7-bisphosphatase [Niveomyces insectorum RCEF 264]|uniref:Sedoheptulose-1,7-bisphosphatase n=1 Tax=Niveomyces insectorum RCEF 264 TaxID=1081102 RepID=A0A162KBM6_9HYPO|nr:sedoheptulose-1,7-bisphosphatase [Niveomyces insectorum RCEF 264]